MTDDIIFDFVVAVTSDDFPRPEHGLSTDQVVHEISHWIKDKSTALTTKPSSMKVKEFIESCEAAGAKTKKVQGGGLAISTSGGNIRLSRATRKLDGAVVRRYMKILGLGESKYGATMDEFQDGVSDDRSEIYRYMIAMRRLAKT